MKNSKQIVDDMIAYKVSLGGSARTYAALNNFVAFSTDFPLEEQLSKDTVNEWCKRRSTESKTGYVRRLSAANELIKYCYAMGIVDYEFDTDIRPSRIKRYEPYIFSDNELCDIFDVADQVPINKQYPLRHLVIGTAFRLQYFCGLRPQENRLLFTSDVDTRNKTLYIRANKRRSERIIPVADDVNEMLKNYQEVRNEFYPDSPYFFPNPQGSSYSGTWYFQTFSNLWIKSGPERAGIRVRPYDLRHRYATAMMIQLLESGRDIDAVIPYLSAYMGHAQFQHTYYYIHLLPKRLIESKQIDLSRFEAYIPEFEPYEE